MFSTISRIFPWFSKFDKGVPLVAVKAQQLLKLTLEMLTLEAQLSNEKCSTLDCFFREPGDFALRTAEIMIE